jgi:hypothetical protein
MKTREFAEIVLKILAVYVLFVFLTALPANLASAQMWMEFGKRDDMAGSAIASPFAALAVGIIPLAYLAFAAVLFFGARKLAGLFVRNSEDQVSFAGPVSNDLLAFAFRCLGVYALVTWAPPFLEVLTRTIIYNRLQAEDATFLRRFYDIWSLLISSSTGTLLGILLLFTPKGLLRLIRYSHPAARKENDTDHGSAT